PAPSPTTEKLRRAYQQLALAPPTHRDTIQRAYRDRSRAPHPDNGGQQSEFQAIQEAYKYLKQHYHPRRPLP
ncbi:MAG: J domain-containing protein, partial [Cyanobacteria bacterium P01_H01_bin.130]